ncbi:MAG: chlorite dismutase [Acidobacteria bacterium]|nr:chlorite dismutase [Acidobacteriota bacterium]
MPARRPVTHFEETSDGPWRVVGMAAITGSPLKPLDFLTVVDRTLERAPQDDDWPLRGMASYGRYVSLAERKTLEARQPMLGRPEATRAALIPIAKSATWWDLAQDERRAIFERSAHIHTGLGYLPAIARRLYQSRDLGEPFDFLTWFEYAPDDGPAFGELLSRLRDTEEWQYVVREVDIRLERTS